MRRRISRWRSRASNGEEEARSEASGSGHTAGGAAAGGRAMTGEEQRPEPEVAGEPAQAPGSESLISGEKGGRSTEPDAPVAAAAEPHATGGASDAGAGAAQDRGTAAADPAVTDAERAPGEASKPAAEAVAGATPTPASLVMTPVAVAAVDERAQRLARAEQLVEDGNVAEAIEAYRAILLDSPRDISSRIALGRLYERRGDTRLALEQYEAARAVDAEHVDVLLCVAGVNSSLKQFDAAERELRRAVKLDPTRAAVYSLLGTVAYRRGLYAQAEQELKRAIDLDPTDAHSHFYRGEALNQLYRVDEALDMFERAVALQPGIPRAFYMMGILYDKKGRRTEAADMYRRAREVGAA